MVLCAANGERSLQFKAKEGSSGPGQQQLSEPLYPVFYLQVPIPFRYSERHTLPSLSC